MDASWQAFLEVLPMWMRGDVDRLGRKDLRQLRLRMGDRPILELGDRVWRLERVTEGRDLDFCVNAASNYSPWSVDSAREGFLTIPGGHRLGLCGQTIVKEDCVTGFRKVSSLCLRVARDLKNVAPKDCASLGSVLILGAPGWGKTTLLRDLCRNLSVLSAVAVVDSRRELFPEGFDSGGGMDILSGCDKEIGMEMVLRTMAPDYIAIDEVTAQADAQALIRAGGCGVRLLATAHAASLEDLRQRTCYRPLLEGGMFQTVLLLHKDKSYRRERMDVWKSTNGSGLCWSSAAVEASGFP